MQEIQLQFGKDKDVKPSSKCWFHFSISGSYTYLPVKLHLQRTNTLSIVVHFYLFSQKYMICIGLL